jgi:hypothetical protein
MLARDNGPDGGDHGLPDTRIPDTTAKPAQLPFASLQHAFDLTTVQKLYNARGRFFPSRDELLNRLRKNPPAFL